MAEKAIVFGQDKKPDLSVVMVSDYEAGEELSWNQLRAGRVCRRLLCCRFVPGRSEGVELR